MSKHKSVGKQGKPLADPPNTPKWSKTEGTRSMFQVSQNKMASDNSNQGSKTKEDDTTTTTGLSVIPPSLNAHCPKRVVHIPKRLQETSDELSQKSQSKSASRSKDSNSQESSKSSDQEQQA